jgi:vacuolar-type H+-ATPase subunit I/STV1
MSAPKKVLPIENDLTAVPSLQQETFDLVSTHYSELIQNNLVDAMLVKLSENGFLEEPNLQRIRQIVEERKKKEQEIQTKRNAQAEAIRKAKNTLDAKFPRLFRQNRLTALEYLKSKEVNLEELTTYLKTLEENPRHFESLFGYDVPAAIAMLNAEIEKRQKT